MLKEDQYMKQIKKTNSLWYDILVVVIVLIVIAGPEILVSNTYSSYTVTNKEVKNSRKSSKYLVFCKDKNGETKVLEDTDTWFLLKFNSSDIYGSIEVGKTYTFKTRGIRLRLLSWYPNIYTAIEEE